MLLALLLATDGQAASTQAEEENALVRAVNEVRERHNLRPVRVDPPLVRAARAHSATLLRKNVLEHGAFALRMARSGARGPLFGENLAWAVGTRASARAMVNSWMSSPGHRANLLRPGWTRVGIGALKGRFLGYRGAVVVTVDFAGS